ncbi:MAG: hypothetical protein JXB48_00510 [Candidatus Latescibacteria bacterium]|nr:hypothetical protein [Candidatus Latescibacterota bacterium]
MRINPQKIAENLMIKQVETKTVTTGDSANSVEIKNIGETLSGRLLSLFDTKGGNVPRSTILDIASKLAALDMKPSDVDGDIALKALLLQHNNIPLSRELLLDSFESDPAVFTKLNTLVDSVLTALSDSRVTGEIRTTLGIFIKNLDSLFRPESMQEAVRNTLTDHVSEWSRSIELKILSLLLNNPEAIRAAPMEHVSSAEVMLMLSDAAQKNPQIDVLMEKLGDITGKLLSRLYELNPGTDEFNVGIRQAVAVLSKHLTDLIPDINAILQNSGNPILSDDVLAVFFSEHIQLLEEKLLSALESVSSKSVMSGSVIRSEVNIPLHKMLRNSGMSFEWQLLAWYRSGKNPERLRELMQRDIKGILDKFMTDLNLYRKKSSGKSILKNLEREAKSVLDCITQRQISNILQDRGTGGKVYFELPLGNLRDKDNARVTAEGGQKSEENGLNPENFNLSFDVETTGLGRLYVTMNVQKKNISLEFLVRDDNVITQAHTIEHELVDSLFSRGFSVNSLSFDVIRDNIAFNKNKSNRRSMDIKG